MLLTACFLSLLGRSVSPQALPEPGRSEFLSNCAVYHGFDGKGGGRAAPQLKSAPADLTKLAKANHGVFSPDAVYRMIDGRDTCPNHRSMEMPIWGADATSDLSRLTDLIGEKPNHIFFKGKRAPQF
jgi:mono/diheme cytochrome c family protein